MNTTKRPSGFRPDIQGLRAIAVGLVVVYHLLPARLTGGFVGVDVFFVISGFLITSHLVKRPPRAPAEFGQFWIRRLKRLLPASLLVLFSTIIAVRLLAPEAFWRANVGEALASAFYGQNWMLIATSVDYLAQDNAPTAVQHFWSLSVEEQFYLFWPLVIAAFWWFAVRNRMAAKRAVLIGVSAIVVLSAIYSVYLTSVEPGVAYFSTFTRAWELAMGGVVALVPQASEKFRYSVQASILSWIGVAAMIAAGVFFTAATPFPSLYAAIPVGGAALVIWAGALGRLSPFGMLSSKISQFLGDHSYSIYLWHWPLIVLLPFVSGELGAIDLVAITVATMLLAMLTKKYVEDGFRRTLDVSKFITPLRFLALGTAAVTLLAGGILVNLNNREQASETRLLQALAQGGPCFGGAALDELDGSCKYNPEQELILSPALAKTDKSDAYPDDCWSGEPFEKKPTCTYGSGKTKVALVGNSHAGHWLPALQQMAEAKDWTITTYLVSRCNPTDAMLKFDADIKSTGCHAYGEWVQQETGHGQYDLIITSERQSVPVVGKKFSNTAKAATAGYSSYLDRWDNQDTPILVIRDTPYPGNTVKNVPDCVAVAADANAECSGTRESWEWMDPLADAAKELKSKTVKVLDPTDYFCPTDACPAVIGETIVYFDASHITATYARSLTPRLAKDIDTSLAGLGAR